MNSQPVLDDAPPIVVPPEQAIPLVENQFARQRHRDWLHVRAQSHRWMMARHLLPVDIARAHADALRYVDLVAGYYVGAPVEALQVISDFSIWFFIWDDHHGRYALHRNDQRWARLHDTLHLALDAPASYKEHPDLLVAGLADCALRFYQPLDERWNKRFAAHFHDVIDAYDQEYLERTTHHVPVVEEYVALRCHTFGYRVWLDCLELAAGKALPLEVLAWQEYQDAGLASQEFSGWYNDLCSLPKELASGELHNLGISLVHHHGLSVPQAVAEVRRRVTVRVQNFLQAEQDLLHRLETAGLAPDLDRTIRHCLFNMRNWISSVYWFHHESGRYRVDEWEDRARPPYISDAQLEEGMP
jgi:epi-isozizaene synthase